MSYNSFIYLSLVLVVFSCKPEHTDTEKLNRIVHLDSVSPDLRYILLIPVDGCSSCVDVSISFSEKYLSDPRFLFIVSGSGYKSTANYYADSVRNSPSLRIDSESKVLGLGLSSSKPILFELQNKKIQQRIEIEYLTADSLFAQINETVK